ncbi:MAG: glycosyltransferase, partial [Roseimicrobium sp.]
MNAKSLHDFGWNVTALTTTSRHARQGADSDLLGVLPPSMEILRAKSWDAYICAAFPRLGRRLMLWLEQQILPEPYFLWRGPAVSAGRQWMQKHTTPPVIYSRAPKFISNVVGLDLKRATGAPWVAHFSDPWTQVPRRGGKRVDKLTHRLEREILAEADAVIFVSEQTAEAIMKQYPEAWRKKVHVIPHGYQSL